MTLRRERYIFNQTTHVGSQAGDVVVFHNRASAHTRLTPRQDPMFLGDIHQAEPCVLCRLVKGLFRWKNSERSVFCF